MSLIIIICLNDENKDNILVTEIFLLPFFITEK